MLMKVSFAILAVSLVAVLVTLGALFWRLRRHLRRSRSADALENALAEIEPAEKSNRH
jgi:Flp pilus assembly protein TadB